MRRQSCCVNCLFVFLMICWRGSTVAAANGAKGDKPPPIPDEVIQMFQPDSTVNVDIVKDQHTENGYTRIRSASYGAGADENQKQSFLDLLQQSDNFKQGGVKIAILYYIVTISRKSDFGMIEIAKEGVSISNGNKTVFQEAFSTIGLERFLDWAARTAKPPHISRNWNSTPFSERPIQVHPTDNLMKMLLDKSPDLSRRDSPGIAPGVSSGLIVPNGKAPAEATEH